MSSNPIPVRVRPAVVADAPGIRLVATTAWPAAYRDQLAPANIAGFLNDHYSLKQISAGLAHPHLTYFVAERLMPPRLGDILGYAFAGPRPPLAPDAPVTDGELYAIYVAPSAQGQRIGYQLWTTAQAALREQGLQRMWIGVLAGNQPARDFYERQGASFDHAEALTIGTQTLPETWYVSVL